MLVTIIIIILQAAAPKPALLAISKARTSKKNCLYKVGKYFPILDSLVNLQAARAAWAPPATRKEVNYDELQKLKILRVYNFHKNKKNEILISV